ncbi:MAG: hypothetical protein AAB403_19500 [Planctomycetota bacterium]
MAREKPEMSAARKAAARVSRPSKYQSTNLVPMFREAAAFRRKMRRAGFTDNGGAIHSAERILDLLGQRLKYPGLGHRNNLRHYEKAQFSDAAWAAHRRGKKVLIEHVAPLRDFTRKAIEKIEEGATPDQFEAFVRHHYQLVLLTPAETRHLNGINRSRMIPGRLASAGIKLVPKAGRLK